MAEGKKIIEVGDNQILIDWGSAGVMLTGFGPDEPMVLGLDSLHDLLDALHEAHRAITRTERIKTVMRLPAAVKDALEAKARRQGISQNAALVEAIERYIKA